MWVRFVRNPIIIIVVVFVRNMSPESSRLQLMWPKNYFWLWFNAENDVEFGNL